MRRLLVLPLTVGGLLLLACAWGCSSSGPSGGDAGNGGQTGAPVSFQTDLLPQFELSCGLSSSCHQQEVTDPTVQRVFLGCKGDACASSAPPGPKVYMGLMNASQEDPAMPYVTPNDPTKSYLLYKLEATQGSLDAQCRPVAMDPILMGASGEPQPVRPCGASMPLGAPTLTGFAAKVRTWIGQGAPDD